MREWVLALSLCACNQFYGIDTTSIANDNPRIVLFDNSASTVDLVDMPVPLFLDDTRVDYGRVAEPTKDLRFHDPDTDTDLPFEIEQWNPDGQSVVWVRVPTIDAGSKTDRILMYFGSDAGGTADAAAVWSDYELVAHGNPDQFQSAPRPLAATATAITYGPGAIGSAYQLGLGEHQIEYASSQDLLSGTAFTAEMWLYADYSGSAALNGEPGIIDLRMPLTGGRLFDIPDVAEFVVMQIDVHFSGDISYSPTFVPLRKWVHLVWTYDGHILWLYRNGSLAQIDPISSATAMPLDAGQTDLRLGSPTDAMAGLLDEVRLSNRYRDDAWIDAQYRAMKGTFVLFPRPGEVL